MWVIWQKFEYFQNTWHLFSVSKSMNESLDFNVLLYALNIVFFVLVLVLFFSPVFVMLDVV